MHRFTNRKVMKRIICGLVMFLILFTELPSSFAATKYSVGKYTYAVTVQEANLRDKPDTSGKVIAVLKRNDVMSLKKISGNWHKVEVNGQQGYILSSLAQKATQAQVDKANGGNSGSTTPTTQTFGTVNIAELNLRKEPSESSQVIAKLKRNVKIEILSARENWHKVKVSGYTGYVMSKYIKLGSSGSTTTPTTNYVDKATVNVSELNMRASASNSGNIVTRIKRNADLNVISIGTTWHKVRYNSYTGYVSAALVKLSGSSSTTPIEPPATSYIGKATVNASELNMRSTDSISGNIVTKVRRNAVLNVISVGTTWHRVNYNNKTGYVSANLVKLSGVTATPDPDATPLSGYGYIAGDDVNIRKEPKTGSSKVYTLNKATKVKLLSQTGDWIYIETKYGKGYVSSEFVTDNATGEVATLTMGSKGQAVVKLQERLKQLGYLSGTADGHFGAITRTAITAFQTEAALSADGKAGTKTQEKLYSSGAPKKSTAASDDSEFITLKVPSTGPAVEDLQERLVELNYLASKPDGDYGAVTRTAVKEFQDVQGLKVTGIADETTQAKLFSSKAKENTDAPVDAEVEKPSKSSKIVRMDWWTSDIRSIFARGNVATVTHISSGISWKVRRMGGTNHADVEPYTEEDTAKMKKAIGGSWCWDRHAIIVSIDGYKVAASMNGMPHGTQSVSGNNFSGHHCVHFTNSRTHAGNRWDPIHQAAVERAYKSDK